MKSNGTAWGTDDIPAIDFDQNQWLVAASAKEGGTLMIGENDVKAKVDGDGTYLLRSEETERGDAISAVANDLELYDVQMGLRFYLSQA